MVMEEDSLSPRTATTPTTRDSSNPVPSAEEDEELRFAESSQSITSSTLHNGKATTSSEMNRYADHSNSTGEKDRTATPVAIDLEVRGSGGVQRPVWQYRQYANKSK